MSEACSTALINSTLSSSFSNAKGPAAPLSLCLSALKATASPNSTSCYCNRTRDAVMEGYCGVLDTCQRYSPVSTGKKRLHQHIEKYIDEGCLKEMQSSPEGIVQGHQHGPVSPACDRQHPPPPPPPKPKVKLLRGSDTIGLPKASHNARLPATSILHLLTSNTTVHSLQRFPLGTPNRLDWQCGHATTTHATVNQGAELCGDRCVLLARAHHILDLAFTRKLKLCMAMLAAAK